MKKEKINRLIENGVVAVIRNVPKEKVSLVAESLIMGGVNALEVTVESKGALSALEKLKGKFADHAIIGAGTVLDAISVNAAISSGAEFIVSPILKRDVIESTKRFGKISIPGVMTPTEMVQAMEWGADIIKVFPASVGGSAFIKHMKGPLPQVSIIPTGGVNLNNCADFIKAGAIAVGAGGSLVDQQAIADGNYEKITENAKKYVEIVREARQKYY